MNNRATYHVLTHAQMIYLRDQLRAKRAAGDDIELVIVQEDTYVLRLGPLVDIRIPWTNTRKLNMILAFTWDWEKCENVIWPPIADAG